MIELSPFVIEDLRELEVQDRHALILGQLLETDEKTLRYITEGPWSWTVWSSYGVPVACCGIIAFDDQPGAGWAFLRYDMKRYMIPTTRAVISVLDAYPGPTTVDINEDHEAAIRWARVLGFEKDNAGKWVRA